MSNLEYQVIGSCTKHCNDCTSLKHYMRTIESNSIESITNDYMRSLQISGHSDCDFEIYSIGGDYNSGTTRNINQIEFIDIIESGHTHVMSEISDLSYIQDWVTIKLSNQNTDFIQSFYSNDYLYQISMKNISGSPLITIGNDVNQNDIMDNIYISDILFNKPEIYFSGNTNIYFGITGGTINVRIDKIKNYF